MTKPILILAVPPTVVGLLICVSVSLKLPMPVIKAHGRAPTVYSEPLLSEVIEKERTRAKPHLPKGLIEAVISHESGFNETAFNPERASKCYRRYADEKLCGSSGLMQTVAFYHGTPRDWRDSIRKGTAKLRSCYRKGGSIWRTAKCYNGTGPRAEKYADRLVLEFNIWKKRT